MLVTDFTFKNIVYRFICGVFQVTDLAVMHPTRERARIALKETMDYVEERMSDALGLETQREAIEYSLGQTKVPGHYLEFGVFTGGTIRFIAKRLKGKTIHGFDCFQGLPEAWSGFGLGKNVFDVGGKLPKVPKNVQLHSGLFEESLPVWLKANDGPAAFLHIDCDLYSSTKTIFDLIGPRLQVGTIILFDEYFNYPNWKKHEFKAFQEFVDASQLKYEYLAYARQQVAVRISSLGKLA